MSSFEAALAVHRFGLGARPGEIAAAFAAPKEWLQKQLAGEVPQPEPLGGAAFESAVELVRDRVAFYQEQNKQPVSPLSVFAKSEHEILMREVAARVALGLTTAEPLLERLVWFWSNHFTVSVGNGGAAAFLGCFEREAIRPHVLGSFEDMLLAVVRHPAMLLYLNNAPSIGPHSAAGLRLGKGLNENLGRELLELHTLGVDGGYDQANVIAMANLLTGWSLDPRRAGGFGFFPARHEPGAFVMRGKMYPAGEEGGIAAVKDLAHDPATARHIARKFAQYFVADDPPEHSIAQLERAFVSSRGDLRVLALAAIDDPAAWNPELRKLRSPVEYVTASMRALGWEPAGDRGLPLQVALGVMRLMGEFPFSAPSPKGWPEDSASWSGPNAILNRIEWAHRIGSRVTPDFDALEFAEATLGPLLDVTTRSAIKSADTPGDGVALLLASPEFQRR